MDVQRPASFFVRVAGTIPQQMYGAYYLSLPNLKSMFSVFVGAYAHPPSKYDTWRGPATDRDGRP